MKKLIQLSVMPMLAASAFALNSCATQAPQACGPNCTKACCAKKKCAPGCKKACCAKKKCAPGCKKACCAKP